MFIKCQIKFLGSVIAFISLEVITAGDKKLDFLLVKVPSDLESETCISHIMT